MVIKQIRKLMILFFISTLCIIFSCSKKEETPPPVSGLPKVTTSTISDITKISAQGGGNVSEDGKDYNHDGNNIVVGTVLTLRLSA